MWSTWIFAGTAVVFVGFSLSALWHLRWMRRLPAAESASSKPLAEGRPQCSVIIAARNEEARIEKTVRSLLAQQGVETELIVVDDRSVDRTGEILRALAREDRRVTVKRVDVLPEGWLGKCHACRIGASEAKGEWLLFTDADCWLQPDLIRRALAVAEQEHAHHVTLAPGTKLVSAWAQAWHLLFLISLSNWFSGVNRDRRRSYLGIGAFNLIQTAAYRECGGYEALRLTVVDDVKLGLLLRRAGKRTRAYLGAGDIECHWGSTLGQMVHVMEKNYFAALDYRLELVIGGSLVVLLTLGVLVAALVSGQATGLAAALSPLLLGLPGCVLARRIGLSWRPGLRVPFMFPVFMFTLWNSTVATLRRGGVRWRETFYPLAALRRANVR